MKTYKNNRSAEAKRQIEDINNMVELGEICRTTIDEIGMYLSRRKGLLIGFSFEKHLSNAQIGTLHYIVCCVVERNKLNLL